jgi:monovalent cation:H+ antiporter-2, CPA2 family
LIGEMLKSHGQRFVAVDSNPAIVRAAVGEGFPVLYGDIVRSGMLDRLGLDRAQALVVTMDEPVLAARIVKMAHGRYPELPIIVRARDAVHAAELYRLGATDAVPETLESSLQLSEAVLIDLGYAMGPVIASIHEKRDEFRAQIMEEGQLAEKPKLKSGSLRERSA